MVFSPAQQKCFATHYDGHEVHPTRHQDLMRRVFQLRYDVYCTECRFLEAQNYPDQGETDEYDSQSAHFTAFDQEKGLAGYVRLVYPDSVETFPFRNHCAELLPNVELPPASESAEISRLMVREDLRRRRGDLITGASTGHASPKPAVELRSSSPQILLSLYREMYTHSVRHGIRYWYAAMERSLARTLVRMNFGFQQIGPVTNYYGLVAPYVADLREFERRIGQCNPALLAWMQREPTLQTRHEFAVGAA